MKRNAFTSILLATATAAALGCVDDDSALPDGVIDDVSDGEPEPDDADGVAYTPQATPGAGRGGAPAGDDPGAHESNGGVGRFHDVTVQVAGGTTTVTAEEHADGALVVDGDIEIGTVADLLQRSTFHIDLAKRWPNGVVLYAFDSSWNRNDATDLATMADLRSAMDRIAQRSPLRFVERTTEAGYISIKQNPDAKAHVGYRGNAQNLQLDESKAWGTHLHELMHAAGLFHEQSRSDRGDFVTYFPECTEANEGHNFNIEPDTTTASRFDFRSIMLYSSGGKCKPDTADRDRDGDVEECSFRDAAATDRCWTLENKSADCPADICTDEDGDGVAERIRAQRDDLGVEDVNALWAMYGAPLGAAEQGDFLGQTIATGDFDGDGYQDVAVAAPNESPSSDPESGVVFLFRGTRLGLQPWRSISQETRPVFQNGSLGTKLGNNDRYDRFGSALAVGDFNNDGVHDLAVGVPGETYGEGTDRAGAVMIFVGHRGTVGDARHGLQPWFYLGQDDIGANVEADDRFGSALAAGDFDGTGADELAVGSPGEASPGFPRSGAIFVVKGGSTISRWLTFTPSNFFAPSLENQGFGATLAAGDIDADGKADLVAGAPGHKDGDDAGVGAVAFFRGGSSLTAWRWDYEPGGRGAHRAFGNGLAMGNLDGRAGAEVTVTAPLHDGGRVYVFRLADDATYPTSWKTVTQSSLGLGNGQFGDLFGQQVAIGDVDADSKNDLVIGVPRQLSNNQPVGRAVVVKGTGSGFSLIGTTPYGADGAGGADGLGTDVAIVNVDARGRREILVTAPFADTGTTPDTGAVFQYEVGDTVGFEVRVDQRSKGSKAD